MKRGGAGGVWGGGGRQGVGREWGWVRGPSHCGRHVWAPLIFSALLPWRSLSCGRHQASRAPHAPGCEGPRTLGTTNMGRVPQCQRTPRHQHPCGARQLSIGFFYSPQQNFGCQPQPLEGEEAGGGGSGGGTPLLLRWTAVAIHPSPLPLVGTAVKALKNHGNNTSHCSNKALLARTAGRHQRQSNASLTPKQPCHWRCSEGHNAFGLPEMPSLTPNRRKTHEPHGPPDKGPATPPHCTPPEVAATTPRGGVFAQRAHSAGTARAQCAHSANYYGDYR